MNLNELSQDIYDNSSERSSHYYIELTDGIKVTSPNYARVNFIRDNYGFDIPLFQMVGYEASYEYKAGIELWKSEIPCEWIVVLKTVVEKRASRGIEDPLDPISVVRLILEESAYARDVINKNFIYDIGIFSDVEKLRTLMNLFLRDEDLLPLFMNYAEVFQPYRSTLDYSIIGRVFDVLNLEKGKVLDAGCGTGINIYNLKCDKPDFQTYGFDIQNYNGRFSEDRKDILGVNFYIADLNAMPFSNESFDVVILGAVAGHLSLDGVQKAMNEVARTLKQGGYIIIGPRIDEDTAPEKDFTVFKKEGNEFVMVDLQLDEEEII